MSRQISRVVSGSVLFAAMLVVGVFIYPHVAALGVIKIYVGREPRGDAASFELNQNFPPEKELPRIVSADKLPQRLLLDAPFSPQAPFENWEQPWQDACEEASVLMAAAWARGMELTPALAAEEILKQVAFEEKTLGYHYDTNISDTARMLKDFYNYEHFEIRKSGVTVEGIKREIASGNLVIVPLAGGLLENPYFVSPPHYHMAVVRGYDDETREFIVNEPGTKWGKAFRYSYENLMESVHDWTGSSLTILSGEKVMLIVRPLPWKADR